MAVADKKYYFVESDYHQEDLFAESDQEDHVPYSATKIYDSEKTDRELNRKIEEANAKIEKLVEKTEKSLNQTKGQMETDFKEVKKQIDESKGRVVETLALFAALFTFLSLQVQIFKEERDAGRMIALILITGGIVTFFVLILDLMIKSKNDSESLQTIRFSLLLAMSMLMIISGVLLMKV